MIEFTRVDGKNVGDVKMLALSTCVWCKKTKAFLCDNQIEFYYLDADLLSTDELDVIANEWTKYNPRLSFPTIVVNNSETIIGYDLDALKRLVGV